MSAGFGGNATPWTDFKMSWTIDWSISSAETIFGTQCST